MRKFKNYTDHELRQEYAEYIKNPPSNANEFNNFNALENEMSMRHLLPLPSTGRQTSPTGAAAPYGAGARIGRGPEGEWNSLGEFAASVRNARGPSVDPRLIRNAPTTYGTEGVGADGGFAVPPEFNTEIKENVMGDDTLMGRCDQIEISGNSLTIPKDETTPWQTSGGLLAYWEAEAGQLTESKPALDTVTFKTNKITALVPVTEELFEDAPGLDKYLRMKVPQKFRYKIDHAIIQGTGAGQPLGILNSGCVISVAKGSGQSADTIIYENLPSMYSRLPPEAQENAIWIVNPSCRSQLMNMTFDTSGGEAMPVFLPGQSLSPRPFSTLMGLPVVWSFASPTLGDQGDIILADLRNYGIILKSSGLRTDVSMHLYFDYDMLAYRFVMRMTGQPWWRAPITAPDTLTYSPFVTLDERS